MARFNLTTHCLWTATTAPERTALIVTGDRSGRIDERWTYGDLAAAIDEAGRGLLALGAQPGDRVLLRVGNHSGFPIVFFGALKAGLVAVPTSTLLTEREVSFIAADSGARLIITDGSGAVPNDTTVPIIPLAAVRAAGGAGELNANTDAEDPAFLVYTSGTSGTPKGVLHAHRALIGRAPMHEGWYGLTPDDKLLHAGAFNWTYTLGAGLMDPWTAGATAVVLTGDRSDPVLWLDLIEGTGATLFAAVPSLYRRLLKYAPITPTRMPALRHGLTAGEALPAALHADWVARTGRPLYEALGMSEISTYVSSGPQVPTRPGSPGRPQVGRRIAILDPHGDDTPQPVGTIGLLAVHRADPGLMLGYWNRPDDTAAAFRGPWFLTGDCARLDADGYAWYEGRADDQMNASGYRVAPQEVEAALLEHNAIADCAVTETRQGDVSLITAFVVLKAQADGTPATADDILAHAQGRLAAYKAPRRIVFVDDLPRTPTGKLKRRDLRG